MGSQSGKAFQFLSRLEKGFDNTPSQLRKPYSFSAAQRIHLATAGYLFFLEALRSQAPAGDFEEMKANLDISFDAGLLDSDIVHVLETQVPPGDLRQISAFRTIFRHINIGIF